METETETKEIRIEKLEVKQEDTENEKKNIELTIQSVKQLADTQRGIAQEELNKFLKKLEQNKEYIDNMINEIKYSIEYIGNN